MSTTAQFLTDNPTWLSEKALLVLAEAEKVGARIEITLRVPGGPSLILGAEAEGYEPDEEPTTVRDGRVLVSEDIDDDGFDDDFFDDDEPPFDRY